MVLPGSLSGLWKCSTTNNDRSGPCGSRLIAGRYSLRATGSRKCETPAGNQDGKMQIPRCSPGQRLLGTETPVLPRITARPARRRVILARIAEKPLENDSTDMVLRLSNSVTLLFARPPVRFKQWAVGSRKSLPVAIQ